MRFSIAAPSLLLANHDDQIANRWIGFAAAGMGITKREDTSNDDVDPASHFTALLNMGNVLQRKARGFVINRKESMRGKAQFAQPHKQVAIRWQLIDKKLRLFHILVKQLHGFFMVSARVAF